MNNEIIARSWWKKNWKWFLSLIGFILACLILAYAIKQGSFKDFAQAYADTALYENAIAEANKNKEVIEILGKIGPLDNLAILEGDAKYSNNKSIDASVRIIGKNERGRMDISAEKKDSKWIYKLIRIRVKDRKKAILILEK